MRQVPRIETRRFSILLIGRAPITGALVVTDSGHHSPFGDYGAGCLLFSQRMWLGARSSNGLSQREILDFNMLYLRLIAKREISMPWIRA